MYNVAPNEDERPALQAQHTQDDVASQEGGSRLECVHMKELAFGSRAT